MNRLALAVLAAAAGCFAAFHGLPAFGCRAGWQLWVVLPEVMLDSDTFRNPAALTYPVTFLTLSLLITVSPFLTQVFWRSRIVRCLGIAISAASLLVLWSIPFEYLGTGGKWLSAATLLHFTGMLLIRRDRGAGE